MISFRQTIGPLILGMVLLPLWTLSWAQDSTEVPDPPSIPTEEELARAAQAAKQQEPKDEERERVGVETRETVVGASTVTEYSRGGQVFLLRVKPKNAPEQYIDESLPGGELIPDDPDGISESYQTNLPKWRLGSF